MDRRGFFADRGAHAVMIAAHILDLADGAGVQKALDLVLQRIAALLRATLHDAIVLPRRFDQLAAFPDVVGHRLLHIHILPSLQRPNGCKHVPVVARGDDNRVDVLVLHHLAQVLRRLRLRIHFLGPVQGHRVRIAKVSDLHSRHLRHAARISHPLTTETDGSDANLVIRA